MANNAAEAASQVDHDALKIELADLKSYITHLENDINALGWRMNRAENSLSTVALAVEQTAIKKFKSFTGKAWQRLSGF